MSKRYRCITKCYHDLRLWNPGDALGPVADDAKVPVHFEQIGKKSEPIEEKVEDAKTFHELQKQNEAEEKRIEDEKKEAEKQMLARAGITKKPDTIDFG